MKKKKATKTDPVKAAKSCERPRVYYNVYGDCWYTSDELSECVSSEGTTFIVYEPVRVVRITKELKETVI